MILISTNSKLEMDSFVEVGSYGKPLCRFYLLLNKMTPEINISVMNGIDLFL